MCSDWHNRQLPFSAILLYLFRNSLNLSAKSNKMWPFRPFPKSFFNRTDSCVCVSWRQFMGDFCLHSATSPPFVSDPSHAWTLSFRHAPRNELASFYFSEFQWLSHHKLTKNTQLAWPHWFTVSLFFSREGPTAAAKKAKLFFQNIQQCEEIYDWLVQQENLPARDNVWK